MFRVENLTYHYHRRERPSLHNVSFAVQPGELVLITGHSGSGKSTLLHCLKGLVPHLYGGRLQGTIHVNGDELSSLTIGQIAERVGLVMQDPDSQFCNLFVRDEIAFGVENLRVKPDLCLERVREALDAVGLPGFGSRTLIELSGGEKQKVAIASILAMDVDALLLDEPTANLDARSGRDVLSFIERLRDEGKTILLVQHELDEMIHLADKLLVLEGGEVAVFGPPREMLEQHGKRLAEEYHIGLPQVFQAALRTKQHFQFERLPLSVDDFVVAARRSSRELAGTNIERVTTTQPATGKPVVEAHGVSYAYPRSSYQALSNISLTVREGEIVAILGKNGSGKSTLARLLVGLIQPQQGEVRLKGAPLSELNKHEIHGTTGYVFQYPEHQFLAQTVTKEIAYGLEVQERDRREIEEIVAQTIRSLRLEGAEERHPFTLSGGEKRRLSVATMLVLEPKLLILDEPTFGLDEGNLLNMVNMLFDRLQEKGVTVLFITHDMRLVAEHANRALVMYEGELIYDDTPTALFQDKALMERAELLPPPIVEVTQKLAAAGLPLPPEVITLDQFVGAIVPRQTQDVSAPA